MKQLSANETKLQEEQNGISTMNFDGNLEVLDSCASTTLDKEQLFQEVQENISFYALQTFLFLPDASKRMETNVKQS